MNNMDHYNVIPSQEELSKIMYKGFIIQGCGSIIFNELKTVNTTVKFEYIYNISRHMIDYFKISTSTLEGVGVLKYLLMRYFDEKTLNNMELVKVVDDMIMIFLREG